jgi:hypothetical protein
MLLIVEAVVVEVESREISIAFLIDRERNHNYHQPLDLLRMHIVFGALDSYICRDVGFEATYL